MYVAMTRARSKVLLVADPHSPSEFVEELRAHPEVHTKDHTVIWPTSTTLTLNDNYTYPSIRGV